MIEYNHIFDAMKVTIDGAGLYVTFAQFDQGCLIRGNLIHDTHGNSFATQGNHSFGEHPPSAGIYLDGYSSGGHYESNVLYRNLAAGPLIFDYKNARQTNSWLDNLFQKEGSPPEEFIEVMQASAGLEPAYQESVRKMEPNPCKRSILIDPKTQGSLAAYQFDLSKKGRGVVEIVRRPEGIGAGATFKFLGLRASADYSLKGYAGPLAPSEVWGPPDPDKPASMSMLSNVISVPLSDFGGALGEGEAKVSGRKLMEQGLSINAVKSPQVIWIAYQRLN